MRDSDEQFERQVGQSLRRYARQADRQVDPAAVAARAMRSERAGAPRGRSGSVFARFSGLAWAGALVALLVVGVVVAGGLGGRPSDGVTPVASPSAGGTTPVASVPSVAPTAPSPSTVTGSPVPTTTPPPATWVAPSVAPSPSSPVPTSPPATAAPSASPAGAGLPAGFGPVSVTFVSPGEGWVLGGLPCASGTCPAIGRTTDAGRTWTPVGAPATTIAAAGDPAEATAGIGSVRFADSLDGWAFGPELWSTHDGGRTWTKQALPGISSGAVVALESVAGTTRAVAYDGQGTFRILATPVGTDAWALDPLRLPVGAGPVPAIQLVLSGRAGWILQDDRTVVNGARLVAGAWQTWQPACADVIGPAFLAAADASHLVAACDVGLWSTPTGAHLFVSSDAGTAFAEAGHRIPVSPTGATISPGRATIVVAGSTASANALTASFDGGASWSKVLDLADAQARDLGFTTDTQGVVIATPASGLGTLFMTRDGGHTWTAVTF